MKEQKVRKYKTMEKQKSIDELIEGLRVDENYEALSAIRDIQAYHKSELSIKQMELDAAWKCAEDVEESYKRGLNAVNSKLKHSVIESVKYGMYLADPSTQNAPEEAEDYYKEHYETAKS